MKKSNVILFLLVGSIDESTNIILYECNPKPRTHLITNQGSVDQHCTLLHLRLCGRSISPMYSISLHAAWLN